MVHEFIHRDTVSFAVKIGPKPVGDLSGLSEAAMSGKLSVTHCCEDVPNSLNGSNIASHRELASKTVKFFYSTNVETIVNVSLGSSATIDTRNKLQNMIGLHLSSG